MEKVIKFRKYTERKNTLKQIKIEKLKKLTKLLQIIITVKPKNTVKCDQIKKYPIFFFIKVLFLIIIYIRF